ncbi:hypothetical protein [Chlorogloea sp. CCALA 695]|uniref:hypothetical protein n=1 Tax=Chlorogloea sp. CCALA 695 TaxID=2107693 RepID=UPI000D06B0D6|nr:hypothetical protein [Chlorogloea sp. CCALA 695]PSB34765.1 hypothetical protein C7B70_02690 [Chlorogloea sp. CCALA 695]
MLQTLKKSLTTAFLLTIPVSAIAIALANKPAIAGCNPFGCSPSSAAECNPFGCPNPPVGDACTPFGCPSSAQPQPQPTNNTAPTGSSQPRGGSPDGIASCVNKLLYKNVEICTQTRFGSCSKTEIRQVRTDTSENVAAQACQNAS